MHIWALTDDRAGNNSQVLGVAEKIGQSIDIKDISYNFLSALPNALLGPGLKHLSPKSKNALKMAVEDIKKSADPRVIVVSAGRRSALVARWIKKQIPQAFICSIMGPDGGEEEFDLIALPEHDKGESREASDNDTASQSPAANHFYTLTAPHSITSKKLSDAFTQWATLFEGKPAPIISVLVGGNTRHAEFTTDDYQKLSQDLAQIRNASGGTLFITTSRRTSEEGVKRLRQYLFSDDVFYKWSGAMTAEDNPYLGMLAHADAVIVTGDSVSMCSEAVFTGKPVYIFCPDEDNLVPKFQRFLSGLFREKYALPLRVPIPSDVSVRTAPDAGREIAGIILEMQANKSA